MSSNIDMVNMPPPLGSGADEIARLRSIAFDAEEDARLLSRQVASQKQLIADMLAALLTVESVMSEHNLSRKHEGHQCPWDFGDGFGGTLDQVRNVIARATKAQP